MTNIKFIDMLISLMECAANIDSSETGSNRCQDFLEGALFVVKQDREKLNET